MTAKIENWIGNRQVVEERLDPARSNALITALGGAGANTIGDTLPLLHHWLYFWDVQAPDALGIDGHPKTGSFLPPAPLPRRMWASGSLTFFSPIIFGSVVQRATTLTKIQEKAGKSGPLHFLTLEHVLSVEDTVAIQEVQNIVFRGAGGNTPPEATNTSEASPPTWRQAVDADQVLLFRYSALTMNGHRIHYDHPYATKDEQYPGLVVHGPLQATLMMALAQRHLTDRISTFDFRGVGPAFDGSTLEVCGVPSATGATLWIQQGGARTMSATIKTR